MHELGDLLQHSILRHLIRELGHHDGIASFSDLLHIGDGPHLHRTAAGGQRVTNAGRTDDVAPRREVRALDELHQLVDAGVGVFDGVDAGVDDLAQVMRRDVGRHADGDSL